MYATRARAVRPSERHAVTVVGEPVLGERVLEIEVHNDELDAGRYADQRVGIFSPPQVHGFGIARRILETARGHWSLVARVTGAVYAGEHRHGLVGEREGSSPHGRILVGYGH